MSCWSRLRETVWSVLCQRLWLTVTFALTAVPLHSKRPAGLHSSYDMHTKMKTDQSKNQVLYNHIKARNELMVNARLLRFCHPSALRQFSLLVQSLASVVHSSLHKSSPLAYFVLCSLRSMFLIICILCFVFCIVGWFEVLFTGYYLRNNDTKYNLWICASVHYSWAVWSAVDSLPLTIHFLRIPARSVITPLPLRAHA